MLRSPFHLLTFFKYGGGFASKYSGKVQITVLLCLMFRVTKTVNLQVLVHTDQVKLPQSSLPVDSGLSENSIDSDADADLFYPVFEDMGTLPELPLSSNQSSNSSAPNRIENEQALATAIEQVLKDAGYTFEDMLKVFNHSLMIRKNLTTTEPPRLPQKQDIDEHSLSLYKERVKAILKERKLQPERINEELSELLRVIIKIEIDDFSEALTTNLRQGFPENRTLLIAMIQAAVNQWGKSSADLPPPFGSAELNSTSNFPPELKLELYNLSNLLTKDLRESLVTILRLDQNKSRVEIEKEMATVEEDEAGVRTIVTSKIDIGSIKPKREVTVTGDQLGDLTITNHEEHDRDDEFTLSEDIELSGTPDESRGQDDLETTTDLINPEHLERIIKQEQMAQVRQVRDQVESGPMIFRSFSRHKRI